MSSFAFTYPVEGGGLITSFFGLRDTRGLPVGASAYHEGIDIKADTGTGVLAALSGTVTYTGTSSARGNYMIVDHGGGIQTEYAHLSDFIAEVGQSVSAGQKIALSGNTGISSGAHLDFRIKDNGSYVNPLTWSNSTGTTAGEDIAAQISNAAGDFLPFLKKYWYAAAGILLLVAVLTK